MDKRSHRKKNLVNTGIIKKDFVKSFGMNVYHDSSEGLAQHFDDAVRFKQVRILLIFKHSLFKL